jgi:hypothetical protein
VTDEVHRSANLVLAATVANTANFSALPLRRFSEGERLMLLQLFVSLFDA